MKELVLFANVNPLSPNECIQVWTSRSCGTINENAWWCIAREHKKTLESLGFKVIIREIITTIY